MAIMVSRLRYPPLLIRQLRTTWDDPNCLRKPFSFPPSSPPLVLATIRGAQLAAEAAEAAGAQGKFWEMHDLLFEHQNALDQKHLLGYAEQLALDRDIFRKTARRDNFKRGVAKR